jgi:hypothetical protein
MERTMKKLLNFLFIAMLTLTLAACSSGGPSNKIDVEMTDFAFTPNHFTVPAGEQIAVNVAHHGVVIHEFIIMKSGTDAGNKFERQVR